MKIRWLSMGGILILVMLTLTLLFTASCSSPTTPATAPSSSAPVSATNPAVETPATKTVKIGLVFWFGSDIGLDAMHGMELMADEDNKNGGIDIGGEKYKVQLIEYDSNNNQAQEISAVNRLIFEDKVKFIISQGIYEGAWIQITEANKVIVLSQNPQAQLLEAPNTRYSYNPCFSGTEIPAKMGWFIKAYPDKTKDMVVAFPDSQFGHMISGLIGAQTKAFGVTPNTIFYPANQQDLSSLGTKVVTLNPSVFMIMSGNSATLDGLVYKAMYDAGYRGQFYTPTNDPINNWLQVMPPQALEGFIMGMFSTEADPALTTTAQHFKELWTAKYGKWNDPLIVQMAGYPCLKAALEKAGTTDVEQVTDVIGSGLKYSAPSGDGEMVSRPDIGNSRTVDSISTYYMKQVTNGKTKLLATISADDALNLFRIAFPPLPPGAAPPGPPGGPPDAGGPPSGGPP